MNDKKTIGSDLQKYLNSKKDARADTESFYKRMMHAFPKAKVQEDSASEKLSVEPIPNNTSTDTQVPYTERPTMVKGLYQQISTNRGETFFAEDDYLNTLSEAFSRADYAKDEDYKSFYSSPSVNTNSFRDTRLSEESAVDSDSLRQKDYLVDNQSGVKIDKDTFSYSINFGDQIPPLELKEEEEFKSRPLYEKPIGNEFFYSSGVDPYNYDTQAYPGESQVDFYARILKKRREILEREKESIPEPEPEPEPNEEEAIINISELADYLAQESCLKINSKFTLESNPEQYQEEYDKYLEKISSFKRTKNV